MKYKIEISFFGKNYSGWQKQNISKKNTIQGEIEKKISLLIGEEIKLNGCCRTDAGVHANKLVADFMVIKNIINFEDFLYKINSFLSNDISINNICEVKEDFDSRFSAYERTYKYIIRNKKDPFWQDRCTIIFMKLDINKMNKVCKYLIGKKDFSSFVTGDTSESGVICDIQYAKWKQEDENTIIFEISANRFLRSMVRSIVGTMIKIGKGLIEEDDFNKIIEGKNRSLGGESAPAKGLYLFDVKYFEKDLNVK